MHAAFLRDSARLHGEECSGRSKPVDQYVNSCSKCLPMGVHLVSRKGCGQQTDSSYRYAFDGLGELFHSKIFGFLREQRDIGDYMKATDSLLPAFTHGGNLPSYLTKLYLVSTFLFSSSVRGALGAVKQIENASEAAVNRRKQEVLENKDDKRDMLRKMLEINADRGENINFTYQHIVVESHSSM